MYICHITISYETEKSLEIDTMNLKHKSMHYSNGLLLNWEEKNNDNVNNKQKL